MDLNEAIESLVQKALAPIEERLEEIERQQRNPAPRLLPVEAAAKATGRTPTALRTDIARAQANGLAGFDAIRRVGRPGSRQPRVLIDVEQYLAWMNSHRG